MAVDISSRASKIFNSLPLPRAIANTLRFSVEKFPKKRSVYIAKDGDGQPAYLFEVADHSKLPSTITKLEHFVVQQNVRCRIDAPSGKKDGVFAVIQYRSTDLELRDRFIRVVAAVTASLSVQPSPLEVSAELNKLLELFRAMEAPARKTVQGLWAELFVILSSRNIPLLVNAWHSEPTDKHDFVHSDERLEVKSCPSPRRVHYFAGGQLDEGPANPISVGSVFVERDAGGKSVEELADEIRMHLTAEAKLFEKFETCYAKILGKGIEMAGEETFNVELAERSLRFFAANDVPKIQPPFPAGVLDVSFKSDLSTIKPLSKASIRDAQSLIAALL